MKQLEMKHCNTILIEKQQKYRHYQHEKLINMNILQTRIITSDQTQMIEQYVLLLKNRLKNRQKLLKIKEKSNFRL